MKSLEIVNSILKVGDLERYDIFLYNEEIQQIKADLEILAILRENLYTEYDTRLYVRHSFDSEHKDFNKVKQWLEENKNDN
jgi:hypothetical protein